MDEIGGGVNGLVRFLLLKILWPLALKLLILWLSWFAFLKLSIIGESDTQDIGGTTEDIVVELEGIIVVDVVAGDDVVVKLLVLLFAGFDWFWFVGTSSILYWWGGICCCCGGGGWCWLVWFWLWCSEDLGEFGL